MTSMKNSLKYSNKKKLHQHIFELKEKNHNSPEYITAVLSTEILADLEKIIATASREIETGLVSPVNDIMSIDLPKNTVEHYVISHLSERTKQLNKDILKLVQDYKRDIQVNSDQYLTWSLNKEK